MSNDEQKPFTVEDVEAAYFASGIEQCLGPGETAEWYIRWNWPISGRVYEELGMEPLQARLWEKYKRGSRILEDAEVVSRRVVGEVTPQDSEKLGQVDSPIWVDDQGHVARTEPRGKKRPKTAEEWMAWGQQRGPRLFYLRALRRCG
jgi:hypothetical protein